MNNDEAEEGSGDMADDAVKVSSSSTSGDDAVVPEDDEDTVNEADRKPRLFAFHFVNSYGSAEVDGIRDDGRPIKFHSEYIQAHTCQQLSNLIAQKDEL